MDKLVNKKRLIKRIYIIMWCITIFFFILKLCFGVWYPIVIENELLISISEWIDNHLYIRNFILASFYCFNLNFIYLITSDRGKMVTSKEKIIITCLSLTSFILKSMGISIYIILELGVILFIPLVLSFKTKQKKLDIVFSLILFLAINVWQLSILFIRDIGKLDDMSIIIMITLQVDYYLFLVILYFRRRCQVMGLIGALWFGKTIEENKQLLEQELAKETPNEEYVAALKKEIRKSEIEQEMAALKNEKETL